MKRFNIFLVSVTALLMPLWVLATPGIPHQFYGTVNFTNGPAPNGLTVEAKTLAGVIVGVSTTKDGKYGYSPNLFFVTDANDGTSKDMQPGQEIRFFVSGIDSGATALFSNGGYNEKNLTVASAIGTITKLESDVITDQAVVVSPQNMTTIKMGESLNVTISSATNTNAIVEKIEKKSSGNVAVFSGKNFLNVYDIKISGASLIISVTMKYDDTGIDENTVKPYKFEGVSWVEIPYSQDKTANTITFTISSGQTVYGIFGSVLAQSSPTPTPSGGGGGGGSYIPPVTIISPLSAEAQKVDANKDGKIDVLDFNSLMVNWGRTGTGNIADFNSDGKVDVFDFNLLMINWTL